VSVETRPALHCIKGGLKLVETFQLSLLAIRHLINAHIQLATREAPGCSAGRRETQHSNAHRPTWVLVSQNHRVLTKSGGSGDGRCRCLLVTSASGRTGNNTLVLPPSRYLSLARWDAWMRPHPESSSVPRVFRLRMSFTLVLFLTNCNVADPPNYLCY